MVRRTAALVAVGLLVALACPVWAAFEFRWPSACSAGVAGSDLGLLEPFPVRPGGAARGAAGAPHGGAEDDGAAPGTWGRVWAFEASGGELYGLVEATAFCGRAIASFGASAVAVELSHLGSDLYRERSIGLSLTRLAHADLACGLCVRALGIAADGVSDRWAVAVDGGFRARMLGRIVVAARWDNLGRATIGGSPVASAAHVGAALRLEGLTILSSTVIEEGFEPSVSFGCEADATDWFRIRAGGRVRPREFAAGVGMGPAARASGASRPTVDIAWQWHAELGVSYFVSVSFAL